MFKARKQEDVDTTYNPLPAPGFHNVTLKKVEVKRTRNGDPMMVWDLVIDSGADAGHRLREFFVFDGGTMESKAWARLAAICDGAGFKWSDEAESLEAFAFQFPDDDSFRFAIDIDYTYRITAYLDVNDRYKATKREPRRTSDCPYEVTLYVSEEEYNEWLELGGEGRVDAGAKFCNNFAMVYTAPKGESELGEEAFSEDGATSGDGVVQEVTFTVDDSLPF